jgi:hypothetical protein
MRPRVDMAGVACPRVNEQACANFAQERSGDVHHTMQDGGNEPGPLRAAVVTMEGARWHR